MSGTLYVVATPIGNLDDLTPRARQTLAAVDLIAVEDTRHSGRLLSHIGVKTRLLALHDHNEEQVLGKVIEVLQAGESVALISDAGTPLLSDPGYRLVQAAHANGVTGLTDSRRQRPDHGALCRGPADRPVLFRGLRTGKEDGTPAMAGEPLDGKQDDRHV